GPCAARISRYRVRNARSSSRFRRSHVVTSSLHLLVLQEAQAGTTLSTVYRPPREIARTQSRRSGPRVAAQWAHPFHAAFSAAHSPAVRSLTTRFRRRLRLRAARTLRLRLTATPRACSASVREMYVRHGVSAYRRARPLLTGGPTWQLGDVEGAGLQCALDAGTTLDDQPLQRRRHLRVGQEPIRGVQAGLADVPRRIQPD